MKNSIICIILASFIVDSYALPTRAAGSVPPVTHYHATCAKYAPSIKRAADSKTLVLGPGRTWPDEFSWSGGFYLTPKQDNAIAYGASFATHCTTKSLGGVVIIAFNFDPSDLRVNSLGILTPAAQDFWNHQMDLGEDIAAYLEHSPLPLPPLPPATDDNPMSQTEDKGPPPPTPEQISEIRDSIPSNWWPAYDDFEQYDVIMGAVEMNDWQQQLTEAATNLGMPPIQSPFVQVVLVTDAALQKLSYVGENALDPGLTKKQPAVDAAFKLLKPSQGAAPQSRGFSFKP